MIRANQPPIPDIGQQPSGERAPSMDYVDIPPVAGRLSPKYARTNPAHSSPTSAEPTPAAPPKTMLSNLPAMLLASTAMFPISGNPSGQRGPGTLLTTRDPLSIPITTVNFRRFVSKVGPVFWLQDRIEEILMWKRGWKVTTVWMAAYAFFCMSPCVSLLPACSFLLELNRVASRFFPKVDSPDSKCPLRRDPS